MILNVILSLNLQTKVPKPSWGGQWWVGSWDGWKENGDGDAPEQMSYSGGGACSSGEKRSTTVTLKCGPKTIIEAWSEPATCEYIAVLQTPDACPKVKHNVNNNSEITDSGSSISNALVTSLASSEVSAISSSDHGIVVASETATGESSPSLVLPINIPASYLSIKEGATKPLTTLQ